MRSEGKRKKRMEQVCGAELQASTSSQLWTQPWTYLERKEE